MGTYPFGTQRINVSHSKRLRHKGVRPQWQNSRVHIKIRLPHQARALLKMQMQKG